MQVIIKVINGAEHSIEVLPDLKIHDLKIQLANELKIPVLHQRLMLKGKPLVDSQTLKEHSIEPGTKIHMIVKKDTMVAATPNESNLSKHLKSVAKNYVVDVDQFDNIFAKELKKLANEMSLDDIERYDASKEALAKQQAHSETGKA